MKLGTLMPFIVLTDAVALSVTVRAPSTSFDVAPMTAFSTFRSGAGRRGTPAGEHRL